MKKNSFLLKTRLDEFEPTQELDKYLLLTSIVDERINKHMEILSEEVEVE